MQVTALSTWLPPPIAYCQPHVAVPYPDIQPLTALDPLRPCIATPTPHQMPAQDALAVANKAAEDAAAVRSKLEPATTDQDAGHFCDPPLELLPDDEAPTVKADQVEGQLNDPSDDAAEALGLGSPRSASARLQSDDEVRTDARHASYPHKACTSNQYLSSTVRTSELLRLLATPKRSALGGRHLLEQSSLGALRGGALRCEQ